MWTHTALSKSNGTLFSLLTLYQRSVQCYDGSGNYNFTVLYNVIWCYAVITYWYCGTLHVSNVMAEVSAED